jgi:deferrochelatase/peroxidase EfeB
MDEGLVSSAQSTPSWKLIPPVAAVTQGIVVTGFASLHYGRALFLELSRPGGAWLDDLRKVAPITAAVPPADKAAQVRAAAIAFTSSGLNQMGLGDSALASFSEPFREGMMQEDRLRRLGDRREGKWLSTVIEGGPTWSGNTPEAPPPPSDPGAFDVDVVEPSYPAGPTAKTVHVLLLLYTMDQNDADQWCNEVEAVLNPRGIAVVHRLPLVLDPNGIGVSSEHFGFADGLSQPEPFDNDAVTVGGVAVQPDEVQGVPLGEFLIGYTNGHHEPAPGPVVPGPGLAGANADAAALLPPHPAAEGFADLGINGSYMVVRELKQDVAKFWQSMDENEARIKRQDPGANTDHVSADWIAERVIGRNRLGHLLCTPAGTYRAPLAGGVPDNAFRFSKGDPYGVGCPPGSHVRRANPRDSLAPIPIGRDGFPDASKVSDDDRTTLLKAANNHRILRRGRKFGTMIADNRQDDGDDRGLLFICLNTDIARQFEFVQQTWLLNADFAMLRGEVDPLVGASGPMTIREEPLRRTIEVETFVKMAGGDYFFLPSLPALDYLARI